MDLKPTNEEAVKQKLAVRNKNAQVGGVPERSLQELLVPIGIKHKQCIDHYLFY